MARAVCGKSIYIAISQLAISWAMILIECFSAFTIGLNPNYDLVSFMNIVDAGKVVSVMCSRHPGAIYRMGNHTASHFPLGSSSLGTIIGSRLDGIRCYGCIAICCSPIGASRTNKIELASIIIIGRVESLYLSSFWERSLFVNIIATIELMRC